MSLIIISVNSGEIANSEHACTDRIIDGDLESGGDLSSDDHWKRSPMGYRAQLRNKKINAGDNEIKLGKLPGNAIGPYLKQYGMQLCRKIEI